MKRQLLIGLCTLVLATSTAAARGPHGMGRGGCPHMGPGAAQSLPADLGLAADQQTKMAALQTKLQQESTPLFTQLQTKHTELITLWQAATPDRNALLTKHSEIDAVHTKLRVLHIDFRLAVNKLLTPEQRTKMAARLGPGMGPGPGAGFGGGRGMGPGRGPCPMTEGNPNCPCAVDAPWQN